MRDETKRQLDALLGLPFLTNVGQPIDGYRVVENWDRAANSCTSEIWESVQLQLNNRLGREVRRLNYARSEQWNDIAAALATLITPVARANVGRVIPGLESRASIAGSIAWDLSMICAEVEYADIVPARFFYPRILTIYAAGHFPCGRDGPALPPGFSANLPAHIIHVY